MSAGLAAALALLALVAPQDLGELEQQLRSSDAKDRQLAVRGLAGRDSEEAWELVLGALEDPAPMVADAAQLALARIPNEDVLELALGKQGLRSRDDLVRERVAEGLGRTELELDPALFLEPLRDDVPAVRRALAWSIERRRVLVAEKLSDALQAMVEKDRDPGVRAAAFMAMTAAMTADVQLESMVSVIESETPELRAAGVLGAIPGAVDQVMSYLEHYEQDPSRSVRTVLAERLAARADAPSARMLVAMLEREGNLRLRWRMVELLQGLSGKGYRLDTRPWRDWADALPEDWSGTERRRELDHGPVTAAFAGQPILSDRLVFLIDLSGSIWREGEDGRTRKQLVDAELRTALEALRPEQCFNLIPYTEDPHPWKKQLAEASPANVAKALDWFEGRRDHGTGDLWEALLLAMEDPEVDSVVVIGDGGPSGGEHWDLRLIKELFRERNRFRRVALDAVLTDPSPSIVGYWRELTAASGGRVLEISFDRR